MMNELYPIQSAHSLAEAVIEDDIEGNFSFILSESGNYYVWVENYAWSHLDLLGPYIYVDYYEVLTEIQVVPPVKAATVDINPQALNLRSLGKWVTAYIELPEGYNVGDIDVSSIMLNNTIRADSSGPMTIGDYDGDAVPDLMVKFSRAETILYIYDVQKIKYGNVTLNLSGELNDGTPFEGSDVIMVMLRGDVNNDRIIDILDLALIARALGTNQSYAYGIGWDQWNPSADLNLDNRVDITDLSISGSNYGATIP